MHVMIDHPGSYKLEFSSEQRMLDSVACTKCKGTGEVTKSYGSLWVFGWVVYQPYRCGCCSGKGVWVPPPSS